MSQTTPCKPDERILGVMILYCDGGQEKEAWVDLKKVGAIAWCKDVKAQPASPNHGTWQKGAPGKCVKEDRTGGVDVCWWDGNEWVCGDAVE